MNIKDDLCEAFCGMLTVSRVPTGYAVGTGHEGMDGDRIGFYVIGPDANSQYRIQDDGLCISAIEASGADFGNKARQALLSGLRDQYAVRFDKDSGELSTEPVGEAEVGAAALRFMAFMLRVQDLLFTTTERTISTFKEEAARIIRELSGDRAEVRENFIVDERLKEVPADLGVVSPGRPPVAVFFGTTDASVMEALLLQSYAENANVPCAVMALLESANSVTQRIHQLASNHLEAVPTFRGDELQACKRIVRQAIGDLK